MSLACLTHVVISGILLTVTTAGAEPIKLAPYNTPSANAARVAKPPVAGDGSLGSAILTAYIASDGTVVGGSGVTGAAKIVTGTYEVDFIRDVSSCIYSAVSYEFSVPVYVQPRSSNNNGVYIAFYSLGDSNIADSRFYLTVNCSK